MIVTPLTYSAPEAAQALGVSEWQVRRMAKSGELPHLRLGKRLLFSRAEIARWVDA